VALSLAAVVLSLCAVVTTVWQTTIMREQLRASVWPRLRLGLGYVGENETQYFRVVLENVGVGPAIITDVEITYHGHHFGQLSGVFQKVMEENGVSSAAFNQFDSQVLDAEQVVPQGQSMVVLLAKANGKATAADLMKRARNDIEVRLRYASIYGEQWQIGFRDGRPRRLGWRDVTP
jgi:hypothetical protein